MRFLGYIKWGDGKSYPCILGDDGKGYIYDPSGAQVVAYAQPSSADWLSGKIVGTDGTELAAWGADETGKIRVIGTGPQAGLQGEYVPASEHQSGYGAGYGEINVPLDVYPYSQSQSSGWRESGGQTWAGLPDWAKQGLQKVLDILTSPTAFTQAYKPVMQDLAGKALRQLAARGVIGGRAGGSTIVPKVLEQSTRWIPSVWAQQLGQAGQLYNIAREQRGSQWAGGGQTSSSYWANPLAPYELALRTALMGL